MHDYEICPSCDHEKPLFGVCWECHDRRIEEIKRTFSIETGLEEEE